MPASTARRPFFPAARPHALSQLLAALLPLLLLCADAFVYPRTTTPRIATALSSMPSSSSASAPSSAAAAPAPADGHVIATLHPNRVLELQLNRPRQLNALSIEMLHELTAHVKRAAENDGVKALLLSAAEGGRAFCAGGDIKQILRGRLTKGQAKPEGCGPVEYISVEYRLDAELHHLNERKPVISVADGIVMGGGAGLFQGAGVRVATPGSTFAMPECRIAIVPDAGAMFFLTRAPGQVPMYVALTGARLSGQDMRATGLATHVVASAEVPALLRRLRELEDVSLAAVEAAVAAHALAVEEGQAAEAPIERRRPLIDEVFGHGSVQAIYDALCAKLAAASEEEEEEDRAWLATAKAALELECPASHVATFHAIRTAQRGQEKGAWGIDQGLALEFVAVGELGQRGDFIEGVQTAVGDRKGETPQWSLASWDAAAADPGFRMLLDKMTGAGSIWDHIGGRC